MRQNFMDFYERESVKLSRIFSAVGASAALLFATTPAKADDWGCEVLLCLSNPAGPMAVAACVPPIQRLYRAIFKPRPDPFPTCDMAVNVKGQRSYATPQYNDYYDPCPDGTTALQKGQLAILGTREQYEKLKGNRPWGGAIGSSYDFGRNPLRTGIGDGMNYSPNSDDGLPSKTCVAGALGNVSMSVGNSDDGYSLVGVYERVVYVDPARNGFSIKVYLDDKLHKVVRPQL